MITCRSSRMFIIKILATVSEYRIVSQIAWCSETER
jgi:hypothetical protein